MSYGLRSLLRSTVVYVFGLVLLAHVKKAAGKTPFKKPDFYHEGQDHIFGIILGLVLGVGLFVVIGVVAFVKFCSLSYHLQNEVHGAEPEPPRFVLFPRLQRSQRNVSPNGHDTEEEVLLQTHRFDELPTYAASLSHENNDESTVADNGECAPEQPNREVSEILAVLQVGRRNGERVCSQLGTTAERQEERNAEELFLEETPN